MCYEAKVSLLYWQWLHICEAFAHGRWDLRIWSDHAPWCINNCTKFLPETNANTCVKYVICFECGCFTFFICFCFACSFFGVLFCCLFRLLILCVCVSLHCGASVHFFHILVCPHEVWPRARGARACHEIRGGFSMSDFLGHTANEEIMRWWRDWAGAMAHLMSFRFCFLAVIAFPAFYFILTVIVSQFSLQPVHCHRNFS